MSAYGVAFHGEGGALSVHAVGGGTCYGMISVIVGDLLDKTVGRAPVGAFVDNPL